VTADDDLQTLLDLARAVDDALDGATFYASSELDELVNTIDWNAVDPPQGGFFHGKGGGMASPSVSDMIEAVKQSKGMLTVAARALGCARMTIYNAAKKHPKLQEAIDDAREETTDLAELKLFSAISNGEAWAISLYLTTVGKVRGYVKRQEIEAVNLPKPPTELTDEELEQILRERGLLGDK
jgi:hypothetical protein